MQLPATREALSQAFADIRGIGGHIEDDLSKAAYGIPVGELPFDPEKDDYVDVMIDSMMEAVTGQLHVEQTIALKPIEMSVVVADIATDENPAITQTKKTAVEQIALALQNSAPHPSDRVYVYKYGENAGEDMNIAAESIRSEIDLIEICRNGLTFVLSDFTGVKPVLDGSRGLKGSVAVKINHATGLQIPSNLGVITLGGAHEVDTSNPDKLKVENNKLDVYHQTVRSRIEWSGLEVAQIVASPKFREGFDSLASDTEIARAIGKAEAKTKH